MKTLFRPGDTVVTHSTYEQFGVMQFEYVKLHVHHVYSDVWQELMHRTRAVVIAVRQFWGARPDGPEPSHVFIMTAGPTVRCGWVHGHQLRYLSS